MKKLKELGISPTPWKPIFMADYWVEGSDGIMICDDIELRALGEDYRDKECRANTHLIAAAPELYDALCGLLEIVCIDCKSAYEIGGKCAKCPKVIAAEKALAKAAGEKVKL